MSSVLKILVKLQLAQVLLADDDGDDGIVDDDDDSDDGHDYDGGDYGDDDDGGDDGEYGDVGEGQAREGVPLHGNCLQRVLVPPS